MQRIIETAVARTGAALGRLLPATTNQPAALPAPEGVGPDTRRALRLTPVDAVTTGPRILALEKLLAANAVRGEGGIVLPRYLTESRIAEGVVIREPDRLVIQLELIGTISITEAYRDLQVRYWEGLWEDNHLEPTGQRKRLNITALYRHALAAVKFGHDLYGAAGITKFVAEVGVTSPLGRSLVVDTARFHGLNWPYTATTPLDLWARREFETPELDTREAIEREASGIVDELLEYWGLELIDDARKAQMDWASRQIVW